MISPEQETLEVELLVVTWNSAHVIDGFLDALYPALDGVTGWMLTVVDNDSSDDTIGRLKAVDSDRLRIIQTGANIGYGPAINRALFGDAALHAGAVLVVNPDLRLGRYSVRAMLEGLNANPLAGIIAPVISEPDRIGSRNLRRAPSVLRTWSEAVLGGERAAQWGLSEVITDPDSYRNVSIADWASGACLLLRTSMVAQLGPWDERFFLYSEESEYCLRARDAGWLTQSCPSATAQHLGGEALTSPRLHSLLTINRVALIRMRNGRVVAWLCWLGLMVNELVRCRRRTNRAGAWALLNMARFGHRHMVHAIRMGPSL